MRQEPKAYSVDGFCEAYGIGRSLAYKLMGEGQLPFALVGRRRLIPVDGADRWLASNLQKAA